VSIRNASKDVASSVVSETNVFTDVSERNATENVSVRNISRDEYVRIPSVYVQIESKNVSVKNAFTVRFEKMQLKICL
jgi:hypothetical protein